MSTPAPSYIMGHTDHERRRLSLQAQFLNPLTEGFFHRAGLAPGMRVLDLGCGVGEVSLIAARIVGPGGHVRGIDIDQAALELARSRAAIEGLRHVEFAQATIGDYSPASLFDAVIGRLILVHTPDPAANVRHAVSLALPGGIIALQECDFTRPIAASPPRPLWDPVIQAIFTCLRKAMPHFDVGSQLYGMLRDAGVSGLQCRGECALEGSPDSLIYEWISETVRSLLPAMEAMGIFAPGEIDPDLLAGRLRLEAAQVGGIATPPMLLGVFGRK